MTEPLELSRPWRSLFPGPLQLSLALYAAILVYQSYSYLGSETPNPQTILGGYLLMLFVPLLFLTQYGRQQIGFGQRISFKWILVGILSGSVLAILCFGIGLLLFGKSEQHWFTSVAFNYQRDERINQLPQHLAFLIFSVPAVLGSPVGEEIFYRGVLERSALDRFPGLAASCFSASLFSVAQLTLHGVYLGYSGIVVMPLSAFLWVLLMFGTGLAFSLLRRQGRSIWTAVVAHAAFNLMMNATIFYSLLVATPQR